MTDGNSPAGSDVVAEIRKQVMQQVARWVISAVVAFLCFAMIGWWFFLEPKIRGYIVDAAGGVPSGMVLASREECNSLPGRLVPFSEGTGRFLVGAGNVSHRPYNEWNRILPNGGFLPTSLTEYQVLSSGGEENHTLSVAEMPSHAHVTELGVLQGEALFGDNGRNPLTIHGTLRAPAQLSKTSLEGGGTAHNILPPYIALYFCFKP